MAHSDAGDGSSASALETEVEDEFACAGMLRGSVMSLHSSVERIFSVAFSIGDDQPRRESSGLIWLKLSGSSANVKAAKLFVKGIVNQEEQQEISCPSILHCVFSGARGLFIDSLIRNTSAHIRTGSPGFLLISGLEKPVVRAYSLISNLIERYEATLSKGQENTDRSSEDTLDSRRAFKALAEKWEDRYILDLLVLPVSVKEILLELVHESGLEFDGNSRSLEDLEGIDPCRTARTVAGSETDDKSARGLFLPTGTQRWTEGEQILDVGLDEDIQIPTGREEFGLLLKFFTAMGYTEDVVKRVLARTGPKEASQILDLVQQEQDRSECDQGMEINRPCETEHREDRIKNRRTALSSLAGKGNVDGTEIKPDDDFVLGVFKKAALSCGYSEQSVTKVYKMLPDRSTHRLLLELQQSEGGKDGAEDMERDKSRPLSSKVKPKPDHETFTPQVKTEITEKVEVKIPIKKAPSEGMVFTNWWPEPQDVPLKLKQTQPQKTQANHLEVFPSVPYTQQQPPATHWFDQQQPLQRPPFASRDVSLRPKERQEMASQSVTGEQRFLEGLQTPFNLKLTDKLGDPQLRMIVIDGSNVAMSHGVGKFFSCRGIALAVQHFWDRGHRHIRAMLPRWRQKIDPRTTEQHFLSDLHDLNLLSYTPSREVQGKRIASYDDRFLLQLADNTDGVIVTNDNLRDLLDESPKWKEIIKKRLLQYTFVGDHFMIPDDPLGRSGPHLNDFLRSGTRYPDPGSHLFAPNHFLEQTLDGDLDQTIEHKSGSVSRRRRAHAVPTRSVEQTAALRESLNQVFPGQDNIVTLVLQCHLMETDVNVLSGLILEQQNQNE